MPSTHLIKATLNRLTITIAFPLIISVLLACGPAAMPASPAAIVLTPPAPTPTPTAAPTATPTAADLCGQLCQPGFWRTAVPDTVRLQLERNPDLLAPGGLQGGSALNVAAAHASRPELIGILLDAGADLEYTSTKLGNTPLIAAAGLNRNPDVAAALLNRGANIEARNKAGYTPLIAAAAFNPNPAVAQLLLQHNADIESRNNERDVTPLHAAAALNPNHRMSQLLLDYDADIDYRAPNGDTVIHTFARSGISPAVGATLLLAQRNLRTVRNLDGQTPCQIASERQPSSDTQPPFTEQEQSHILQILCRPPQSIPEDTLP